MPAKSSHDPLRVRVERGIYRRKTKNGAVRYEIAYTDSDGRQRWATADRLQEARDLRADKVARVKRGERVAPSKVTLREFAEEWLEGQEAKLRPTTHARYEVSLRLHVYPRLGRRRLSDVRVDDVARLVAELERGVRYVEKDGQLVRVEEKPLAAWTIRGCLVALGRVLASAERQGAINSNPVRKLDRSERPRVKRTEFPLLDMAAIGQLIAATPKRYRCLVAVSVLTGLRQGEALGLVWRDIDLRGGTISVSRQLDRVGKFTDLKTDAARRTVPIPPSLARMLRAHKKEAFEHGRAAADDFVFASETGRPLGHRNVARRGLDKATATASLPHLRWHDLRHLAASVLIGEGAPPSYVAAVLGHASPAITLSIYAHVFAEAEHAERTRDRLEAAFGRILG